MSGGAGCPSSVRMGLVEDVDSLKIFGLVGGGVCRSGTVVKLLEVTQLWESGSKGVSGGIRFGHTRNKATVSEEVLDVWSWTDRDGVQLIVDVSFGIFRGRMFELSCFSSCETILMVFAECLLLLLLSGISLNSNSEFTNTFVNSLSLLLFS